MPVRKKMEMWPWEAWDICHATKHLHATAWHSAELAHLLCRGCCCWQSDLLGDWYGVVLITIFNICDLIGKNIPFCGMAPKPRTLLACSIARILFVPAFVLAGKYAGHTVWLISVLTISLGFSNGWVAAADLICRCNVQCTGYALLFKQWPPRHKQSTLRVICHTSSCACQPMCVVFHSICFALVSRLQFVSNVVLPQQDAPVGHVLEWLLYTTAVHVCASLCATYCVFSSSIAGEYGNLRYIFGIFASFARTQYCHDVAHPALYLDTRHYLQEVGPSTLNQLLIAKYLHNMTVPLHASKIVHDGRREKWRWRVVLVDCLIVTIVVCLLATCCMQLIKCLFIMMSVACQKLTRTCLLRVRRLLTALTMTLAPASVTAGHADLVENIMVFSLVAGLTVGAFAGWLWLVWNR